MKVAIINCFETYNIRVNQVEKYFLNKDHVVEKYFSDYSHREKKTISQKKDESITYIKVPKYKRNISFSRLYSHYTFSKKVSMLLKNREYDLIYILIPPNSLLKFILQTTNFRNICVDVIDIWPEAMPFKKFKKLFFLNDWRRYRDNYINKADFIISECNLFKNELLRHNGQLAISTVYFYGGEKRETDYIPYNKKKLSFCYIGSINNLLDINLLCDFFLLLNENWSVSLEIIGSGEKLDALISKVEKTGVKVTSHGNIFSDEIKEKIIKNCNFGINLMKDSTKVGLTMKSIEYMKFGLPLINNIPSDTWEFVEKFNVGLNIKNEKLNDNISFFYSLTEDKMAQMRNNTYSTYIKLFSYESFNKKMDQIFYEFNGEN